MTKKTQSRRTFRDTIIKAFENIDLVPERNQGFYTKFSLAISSYISGLKKNKSELNKISNLLIKEKLISEDYLEIIKRMVNSKYGKWVKATYADMTVYNTSMEDACELSTVAIEDMQWITRNHPIDRKNKGLYKKLPLWLTKERENV